MHDIDFKTDLLPLKDRLFRLALRITLDAAEAEDVTSDTLIRVWTRREELRGVESLEAYCLTVCRNLALDRHERKDAQTLSLDASAIDAPDVAPSPQERLELDDRLARIHELFSRLPEQQRTVMQLRDIEGHSYQEIARILSMSEASVKVTLFRARQTIRRQFLKIDNYGL